MANKTLNDSRILRAYIDSTNKGVYDWGTYTDYGGMDVQNITNPIIEAILSLRNCAGGTGSYSTDFNNDYR